MFYEEATAEAHTGMPQLQFWILFGKEVLHPVKFSRAAANRIWNLNFENTCNASHVVHLCREMGKSFNVGDDEIVEGTMMTSQYVRRY